MVVVHWHIIVPCLQGHPLTNGLVVKPKTAFSDVDALLCPELQATTCFVNASISALENAKSSLNSIPRRAMGGVGPLLLLVGWLGKWCQQPFLQWIARITQEPSIHSSHDLWQEGISQNERVMGGSWPSYHNVGKTEISYCHSLYVNGMESFPANESRFLITSHALDGDKCAIYGSNDIWKSLYVEELVLHFL